MLNCQIKEKQIITSAKINKKKTKQSQINKNEEVIKYRILLNIKNNITILSILFNQVLALNNKNKY